MALRDDLIRHQVFLQRLIKTENKAVAPQLARARHWVSIAIQKDKANNLVKRIVQVQLKDIGKTVQERMLAIAEYEARFTGKILDKYTKYQIEEANKELIKAKLAEAKMILSVNRPALTIQKSFEQFATKKSIDVERALIASDIAKQPKEEKSRVVEALFAGLIGCQLYSLVDTSVNKSASVGRASTYASNSDLVDKVVWTNDLDSNVCPYCEELGGDEMGEDEFYDLYPAHVNCACFPTPIIKEREE